MRCRHDGSEATCALRSGLEWHPVCDECASWWPPHRLGALGEVDPDYEYEGAPMDERPAADGGVKPPRMADEVKFVRRGGRAWLEVDGKPFPWHIAEAVAMSVSPGDLPMLQLGLVARKVVIDDDSDPR